MSGECILMFEDRTARISGALGFATAASLYREMNQKAAGGESVDRIDLSDVSSADSAGLALLLEWQAASGGRLTMTGAPSSLMQLARLSEATDLLRISGRSGA